MGVCSGKPQIGPDDDKPTDKKKRNREIDNQLQQQAFRESMKFKLLLLGTGESGKSTIFKQMKLIYGEEYTKEERETQKKHIHLNILQGMKALVDQVLSRKLIEQLTARKEFEMIMAYNDQIITPALGKSIITFWADPIIHKLWKRRSEYQIIDSVKYYVNKLDEILKPGYVPTFHDILHTRVRTSGILCDKYTIDGYDYELYDVGGQRNERKKWIHCFEGVNSVLFVAALSEYDQTLFEDESENRMVEALNTFGEICNNEYFKTTSMILFLNKRDLFARKIAHKSIKDIIHFADYNGKANDYNDGVEYFVKKFLERNKSGSYREIYYHITCATETSNIRVVFEASKDIILKQSLMNSELMIQGESFLT